MKICMEVRKGTDQAKYIIKFLRKITKRTVPPAKLQAAQENRK